MLQNNNLFNILSSSIVNNPDQLIFGSLFLSMVGFITYSIYKSSSSTITTNVSTQTDSSLVNEQGIQTDNPLLVVVDRGGRFYFHRGSYNKKLSYPPKTEFSL
jgi:hypothetical protein